LDKDDVLPGIWKCQIDLRRCLREQSVGDLIDLLGVLLQMGSFRTYVNRGKEKLRWKRTLDVEVPLLYVTSGMVLGISLGNRLHDLGEKLLRPLDAGDCARAALLCRLGKEGQ